MIKLKLFSLFLLLAGGLAACSASDPTPAATPSLVLEPCTLAAPGMSQQIDASCGTLAVLEDPADENGSTIDLYIAVVPSVSRNPEPDPLFFITGGPGQAATESYPLTSGAFQLVHQKREIVLVDQRGTGQSAPLTCDEPELENEEDLSDEQLAAYLQDCLDSLEADPALYTTSIAMHDLDQVREALGYTQINLYGVSYGTRAALTYLKLFPDRVRTLVLDGVVPQDEPLGIDVARDAQRALNAIFTRCEAEPSCQAAFPDLANEFDRLLSSLEDQPAELSLIHPATGEPTELTFTSEMLGNAVRLLSYGQETASLLPLLIHSAQAEGRLDLLASQYLIVAEDLGSSINSLMSYSVLCAEDVPYFTPEQQEQAGLNAYLGDTQVEALLKVCEIWPRGETADNFKEPVSSPVPTLILSGEFDPVTPPDNGEQVASSLPNSLHVVLPGQGHNVAYRGCVPSLINQLIDRGSIQSLDSSCATLVAPMPFFVNFSGPTP